MLETINDNDISATIQSDYASKNIFYFLEISSIDIFDNYEPMNMKLNLLVE